MLLDCYPRPVDLPVPEISDPILRRMDWIMEDARIHALIRKDLARYYKDSKDGRRPRCPSMSDFLCARGYACTCQGSSSS